MSLRLVCDKLGLDGIFYVLYYKFITENKGILIICPPITTKNPMKML